jgi:hypothetical protein
MSESGGRIRLARTSLVLTALVFFVFGLLFLASPKMIEIMGVSLDTPTARTEIRGFYGGMELGLAFFFITTLRKQWLRPGLICQMASLGGLALGRVVGVLVDGSPDLSIWLLTSVETAGALFGLIAYLGLGTLDATEPARA